MVGALRLLMRSGFAETVINSSMTTQDISPPNFFKFPLYWMKE